MSLTLTHRNGPTSTKLPSAKLLLVDSCLVSLQPTGHSTLLEAKACMVRLEGRNPQDLQIKRSNLSVFVVKRKIFLG